MAYPYTPKTYNPTHHRQPFVLVGSLLLVILIATGLLFGVKLAQNTTENRSQASQGANSNQDRMIPIAGDWIGSGRAEAGFYDRQTGVFTLSYQQDGQMKEIRFVFGNPGWIPVTGDWTGTGKTNVGVYDQASGRFYLRFSNSGGNADASFLFGNPGNKMIPVSGDWDGDRKFGIGLYDQEKAFFLLRNTLSSGPAENEFYYGNPGNSMKPITGDWDGDRKTSIGLYDPNLRQALLRNQNTTGIADITYVLSGANEFSVPLAGNWNGIGKSQVGYFDGQSNLFIIPEATTTNIGQRFAYCPVATQNSVVDNQNLKYFGYFNLDGIPQGSANYFAEVATLNNSNVAHVMADLDPTKMRSYLDSGRQYKMKVIINAMGLFFDRAPNSTDLVLLSNWQQRWDTFKQILAGYDDVVYGLYFDEPVFNRVTTASFQTATAVIRRDKPNYAVMAVEAEWPIRLGRVPQDYFNSVTDIGFDYYYTDYNDRLGRNDSSWNCYLTTFMNLASTVGKNKQLWIVPEGYSRDSTQTTKLPTATNKYYQLAKSYPNVKGILVFLYPTFRDWANLGARDLIKPGLPTFDLSINQVQKTVGSDVVNKQ